MTRALFPGLLLVALAACAIPEDDFPQTYGKAVCKRLKECDKGAFENNYDDVSDCADGLADVAETFLDVGDVFGAEYSPSQARACINDINAASCGEFSSGSFDCDLFE